MQQEEAGAHMLGSAGFAGSREDLPVAGGDSIEVVDESGASSALSLWITDGIERGERVVLITSATLSLRLVDAMKLDRLPVARWLADGMLTLLPASVVVRAVTEGGEIDPAPYDALVGGLLRSSSKQAPVRVLSELTDEAVRQLGPEAGLQAELAWTRALRGFRGAILSIDDLSRAVGHAAPRSADPQAVALDLDGQPA